MQEEEDDDAGRTRRCAAPDPEGYVRVRASWTLHKVGPSVASKCALPDADFAARMQRARVSARLTLQQLAHLCYVPAAQLALFERNEDTPSESTMQCILKVCHDARETGRGASAP